MNNRIIIATIVALLQTAIMNAADHCAIHFDKAFYVTGEVAWFRVYLPQSLEYDQSLIQVYVIAPSQEVIETLIFPVDEKIGASGYLKIPYDWDSGVYHFVVSAYREKDHHSFQLLHHPVSIYNDLKPEPALSDSAVSPTLAYASTAQLSINIEPSQTYYHTRNKVKVTIKVTDQSGAPVKAVLTASVRDLELTQALPQPSMSQSPFSGSSFKVEQRLILNGQVSRDNQGLSFAYLAAILPEEGSMQLFNGDQHGAFNVAFPAFYGNHNLQVTEYRDQPISVMLNPPIDFEISRSIPLIYNTGIRDYLEISRKHKKVEQIFQQMETPKNIDDASEKEQLVPDKSILLSNYEPFEDLTDLFKQIFTPFKLKKKKSGDHEAKMVNPDDKPFYLGPPLILIDGYITRDVNFVAALDIDNIERVDLFFRQPRLVPNFGSLGRSGVVMISTKDKAVVLPEKDRRNIFSVQGQSPQLDFPQLAITAASDTEHTPYFRPVVYWNPMIETNDQGVAEIEFQQSDDRSTFEIEVLGRSVSGVFGKGYHTYLVE